MYKRKNQTSPQGKTARILVEFMEVAITSIVFLKGVYSPGAFERRRYMNVVAHKARHPQLRAYIHDSLAGLLPSIEKGLVERVVVVFFNKENIPLERFVFKLTVNQSYDSEVEQTDLEFSLKSFLTKLSVSESLTKVLPRALNEHWGGSGTSSDGGIGKRSKLKNIKLESTPPVETQSPHSRSLTKSTCVESHFFAHSQRASEEIQTSKKSLSNLEAELDDVQKKVQSAKKEVKGLKSKLEKDDLIACWRSEVTSLKAELAAAKVEKDSAAQRFEEKIKAKNQEIEDLQRQLVTERARHKEEKDEAYARFGNDVVALIRKFKAAA